MSDTPSDTPSPESAPEAATAAEAPAPVAVAVAEPVTAAPPAPEAAAPAAPVAAVAVADPPAKRGSVQVPVWALIVVTVLVVGVGAFFVGRETAPSSGDSGPTTLAEAVQETASGEMEVGDFDLRTLLQALAQNPDLNLGSLGDLILGQGGRN